MGGGVVGSVPRLANQPACLVGIPPRSEDELGHAYIDKICLSEYNQNLRDGGEKVSTEIMR